MELIIVIFLYFVIGIIASRLYNKRDRRLSALVDHLIYNKAKDEYPSCFYDGVSKMLLGSFCYVGFWFWRTRPPFCKWPFNVRNIFGLIFWPIDIVMCEIGYKRQFSYLNSKEKLSPEIKHCIKMDAKTWKKIKKGMKS